MGFSERYGGFDGPPPGPDLPSPAQERANWELFLKALGSLDFRGGSGTNDSGNDAAKREASRKEIMSQARKILEPSGKAPNGKLIMDGQADLLRSAIRLLGTDFSAGRKGAEAVLGETYVAKILDDDRSAAAGMEKENDGEPGDPPGGGAATMTMEREYGGPSGNEPRPAPAEDEGPPMYL